MPRSVKWGLSVIGLAAVVGCGPSCSPNTYATGAVQQVNKVEPGVVIGFRQVTISAGATGGAAGGVLGGTQSPLVGINSALGAVGGTAIGSIIGTTIEHASGDTTGWEYIVRKANGDLLSVTQREQAPLPLGQKVLVIAGNQARIVADYSVEIAAPAKPEKRIEEPARKTAEPPVPPISPIVEPQPVGPQTVEAAPDAATVTPPPTDDETTAPPPSDDASMPTTPAADETVAPEVPADATP